MAPPTASSLLIVGTDTVLAAAPCTSVQLMHACVAAGFEAVVPASWGDELVAARVLDKLKGMDGPAVQCSCPRVSERLAAHADAIAPMMVCTVPPPVATAEYLRALYAPSRPTIVFAGGCGGGGSDSIDSWMSSDDLFKLLESRGVSLASQPTEFDALPPDRRRFHSDPGGMPSRASLRQLNPSATGVEMTSSDFVSSLGQLLLGDERVLVDLAASLGCACAGATAGVTPMIARARVREHEPPRAPSPVVDHRVPVTLDATVPVPREASSYKPSPPASPALATETEPVAVSVDAHRRRSPAGTPRPVLGAAPRSSRRSEGRALPRAYVARRRSSPRGLKTIEPPRESGSQPTQASRPPYAWLVGGLLGGALGTLLFRFLL